MTPELYNKEILGLAANMTHLERLTDPDVTATKTSRICGSKVTVDLKLKDGVIVEFAQEPKACALGQASCALAASLMEGETETSFAKAAEQMSAMLKENGPPPEGKWEVFKILNRQGIYPHATHLSCYRLTPLWMLFAKLKKTAKLQLMFLASKIQYLQNLVLGVLSNQLC